MGLRFPYHSLEDYLTSNMLTVDVRPEDGWNAFFPVKGREIEATVLFADISSFSARTASLDPTETLAFVNHFFAWITAEALGDRPGIVDKYIGDEVMIVFSEEFGSEDPFVDAVQAARWMGERDAFSFAPHIGIASGEVIVGYVGTPLKYDCSVFGAPVALANRCAGTRPRYEGRYSSSITFPASDWGEREFAAVFPARKIEDTDGETYEQPHAWRLLDPSEEEMKNLGRVKVRHIINEAVWLPEQSAEDRAREIAHLAAKARRRWHRERPTTTD
jgi:hypothetical protein